MSITEPMGNVSSIAAASQWVAELLQGRLATAIATMAVAVVGYQMITGRLSARTALRVLLGCFVLFGSSAIASGLMGAVQGVGVSEQPRVVYQASPVSPAKPVAVPTPAAEPGNGNPFDPYASNPQ